MKNKRGQVISEIPIKPKNSQRKIIIIFMIIVVLLIVFLLIRMKVESSMNKKLYDVLDTTLSGAIKTGLNTIKHENKSFNDLNEMQNQLIQNKLFVENQLNDIEIKGETEIYDMDITFKCPNGTLIDYDPDIQIPSECYSSIENKGYKVFKVSGKTGFVNIAAESMTLTLSEYMIDSYKNIHTSRNDMNFLIGQTLETIDYLDKKVYSWQMFQSAVNNISRDDQSLLYKNSQKVVLNLKNFNDNYKTVTEQDIQGVNIKVKCIDLFNKIQLDKYSDNQFSTAQKLLPKNFVLFIGPNFNKICSNIENIKKQQAKEMLNRISTEKNPFVALESKLYLNLFVKCNNEWFSSDYQEPKPCMEAQKTQLINDLQTELNKP